MNRAYVSYVAKSKILTTHCDVKEHKFGGMGVCTKYLGLLTQEKISGEHEDTKSNDRYMNTYH